MILKTVRQMQKQVYKNYGKAHPVFGGRTEREAKSADYELMLMRGRHLHNQCPRCRLFRIKNWFSDVRYMRVHLRDHHRVIEQIGPEYEESFVIGTYLGNQAARMRGLKKVTKKQKIVMTNKMRARKVSKQNLRAFLDRYQMAPTC